jgi:hypothetical protein
VITLEFGLKPAFASGIRSKNGTNSSCFVQARSSDSLGHGVEEMVQSFGGLFGSLFREKMAAIERVSLNVVAPHSPERNWSRLLDVPSIECLVSTLEH